MRGLNPILDIPTLGSSTGKTLWLLCKPLGLTGGCRKLRLCSLRPCGQPCLFSVPEKKLQVENCLVFWPSCQDLPSASPSPHKAPDPAPPARALLPAKVESTIMLEISGASLDLQISPLGPRIHPSPRQRLPSHQGEVELAQIFGSSCWGPSSGPNQSRDCHCPEESRSSSDL